MIFYQKEDFLILASVYLPVISPTWLTKCTLKKKPPRAWKKEDIFAPVYFLKKVNTSLRHKLRLDQIDLLNQFYIPKNNLFYLLSSYIYQKKQKEFLTDAVFQGSLE